MDECPQEFPGSSVVRTLYFHCRGHGFETQLKELRSCMLCCVAKKKKKWMNVLRGIWHR